MRGGDTKIINKAAEWTFDSIEDKIKRDLLGRNWEKAVSDGWKSQ